MTEVQKVIKYMAIALAIILIVSILFHNYNKFDNFVAKIRFTELTIQGLWQDL